MKIKNNMISWAECSDVACPALFGYVDIDVDLDYIPHNELKRIAYSVSEYPYCALCICRNTNESVIEVLKSQGFEIRDCSYSDLFLVVGYK